MIEFVQDNKAAYERDLPSQHACLEWDSTDQKRSPPCYLGSFYPAQKRIFSLLIFYVNKKALSSSTTVTCDEKLT